MAEFPRKDLPPVELEPLVAYTEAEGGQVISRFVAHIQTQQINRTGELILSVVVDPQDADNAWRIAKYVGYQYEFEVRKKRYEPLVEPGENGQEETGGETLEDWLKTWVHKKRGVMSRSEA